jgi:hypothetical protein
MKTTSTCDKPAVDPVSLQQLLYAADVMQQHNERLDADQSQPPEIPHLWSSLWEPQRTTEKSALEIVVESVAVGDVSDPLNVFPSRLEDAARFPEQAFAEAPSKAPEEKPSQAAEANSRWEHGFWGPPLETRDQELSEPLRRQKSEFDAATLYRPKATEVSRPAVSPPGLDSRQADIQLQFLREKSLGSAYYKPDSRGRSAVAFAVLAIILAGATHVEWPFLRVHVQSVLRPVPARQLRIASARPTQPSPVIAAEAHQSGSNDKQSPGFSPPRSLPVEPEEKASDETNSAGRLAQPVQPSASVSLSEPVGLAADGTHELLAAERYLDGRGVAHDSGQAAVLLWKAVSEQNTRADILLADLYLLGDGVPKSCDQARLLLVAAAKKGAPEAALKLRNIESGGCR